VFGDDFSCGTPRAGVPTREESASALVQCTLYDCTVDNKLKSSGQVEINTRSCSHCRNRPRPERCRRRTRQGVGERQLPWKASATGGRHGGRSINHHRVRRRRSGVSKSLAGDGSGDRSRAPPIRGELEIRLSVGVGSLAATRISDVRAWRQEQRLLPLRHRKSARQGLGMGRVSLPQAGVSRIANLSRPRLVRALHTCTWPASDLESRDLVECHPEGGRRREFGPTIRRDPLERARE